MTLLEWDIVVKFAYAWLGDLRISSGKFARPNREFLSNFFNLPLPTVKLFEKEEMAC